MTESIPATTSPDEVVPRKESKPGLILATIVTCQLMLVLDATIVNIALPRIQTSLKFSDTNLSWVLNAYTLAFGGLLLLGGRAGDILGRRRMFISGITLFTAASFLGGLALNSEMLVASRALQGVGAAMAGPSMLALIITTFPDGAPRVRALSIFTAVSSAGGSVGLLLGGMLTSWGSWRLTMYVNVPIGIAAVVAAVRLLQESPRLRGRFDLVGALTSVTGMTSLVYAFISASSHGWGDTGTLVAFAAAGVLLVTFIVTETRVEHPVFPLRLLSNGTRSRAYLSFVLLTGAMFSTFFFTTQFMQKVLGYSPLRTGFAFLPLTVLLFVVSRFVPRLLPRFGPRPLIMTGTALVAVGLFWLSRMTPETHFADGLLGPLLMFGVGAGIGFSPLSVIILSGLKPQESGSGSGLMQACQQVGGALGLSVLVSVFSTAWHGSHQANPVANYTHGLSTALTVGSVFALGVFLLGSTMRVRLPGQRPGSGKGGSGGGGSAAAPEPTPLPVPVLD